MMRLRHFIFVCVTICFSTFLLNGQGCVAIRGNASCSSIQGAGVALDKNEVLVQANYRYFKSFRHFRGSTEEVHRIEEGTEVINHSNFIDFAFNYGITDRIFTGITVPFSIHSRSSMYEHGGNPPNGLGERHLTHSKGLGDIRFSAGYWLFDAHTKNKMNYAVAVGLKLPTGNASYKDIFYNQGEQKNEDRLSVVDQSIQPGDGGFGLTLNIQGYHILTDKLSISNNFYYLANVEETNGILTRNGNSEFSSADQYAVTLGMSLAINNSWGLYMGGRLEGIPSEDIIGGSSGYRRPGYAISIEPGISFSHSHFNFFLSSAIAMYRNRTQSFEDKVRTEQTGTYRHGDAAFADYLINVGIGYRFGGQNKMTGHNLDAQMDVIKDIN
jgi:hypothetical protein